MTLNQEKSENSKKKTYKYLGILQADTIKQVEMKAKIKKGVYQEKPNYITAKG